MDWALIRQSLGLSLRRFTDRAVKVMAPARREAAERFRDEALRLRRGLK
jgi:hypothetical protein